MAAQLLMAWWSRKKRKKGNLCTLLRKYKVLWVFVYYLWNAFMFSFDFFFFFFCKPIKYLYLFTRGVHVFIIFFHAWCSWWTSHQSNPPSFFFFAIVFHEFSFEIRPAYKCLTSLMWKQKWDFYLWLKRQDIPICFG